MITITTNAEAARAFQNARPNLARAIESVAKSGAKPITVWRLALWFTGSTRMARYAEMAAKHYQAREESR